MLCTEAEQRAQKVSLVLGVWVVRERRFQVCEAHDERLERDWRHGPASDPTNRHSGATVAGFAVTG